MHDRPHVSSTFFLSAAWGREEEREGGRGKKVGSGKEGELKGKRLCRKMIAEWWRYNKVLGSVLNTKCVGGQTLLSDTVTMYCTMGNEQYRNEGGNYGGSEVETTNNDGGRRRRVSSSIIHFIIYSPLTVMATRVIAFPWKCSPFMRIAWKVRVTVMELVLLSRRLRSAAVNITPFLLTLKSSELLEYPAGRFYKADI